MSILSFHTSPKLTVPNLFWSSTICSVYFMFSLILVFVKQWPTAYLLIISSFLIKLERSKGYCQRSLQILIIFTCILRYLQIVFYVVGIVETSISKSKNYIYFVLRCSGQKSNALKAIKLCLMLIHVIVITLFMTRFDTVQIYLGSPE